MSTSSAASVQTASQVYTHLVWAGSVILQVLQAWSDDVIVFAGLFCEQSVCLKKGGCLDDAAGSSSHLTSHLYLLTLGLITSTFC